MQKYSLIPFLALATMISPLYSEISLGERLETEMWENMKHRNFTSVETQIADNFQSIHTFGALTRAGEIELIKDLYLGSYEISDFKMTENGDTLVVTYLISVKEKIEDKQLSSKPAPRMSVWQKINGRWLWVAHANLKEIPADKPKIPATSTKVLPTATKPAQ